MCAIITCAKSDGKCAFKKKISHVRLNIKVTPSGIFDYPQLKFCMEVLGADWIIHSVDFPFISNEGAQSFLENAPISEEDKEKIAHANAEALLGL